MCDVRICKVVDAAVVVSGIPLSTLLLTCWIWLHIWGWWWWIPMTSFDTYTMYFNSIKSEMCNQFTKRKTNKDFRRETAHLRSLCVVCMLQRKRPQQTTVTKATAKANGNSTHVSYCNKDTYRERRCTQSELEHGDSNNIDPESSAHSNLLRIHCVHCASARIWKHNRMREKTRNWVNTNVLRSISTHDTGECGGSATNLHPEIWCWLLFVIYWFESLVWAVAIFISITKVVLRLNFLLSFIRIRFLLCVLMFE